MPNSASSVTEPIEKRDQMYAWGVHLFTASGAIWGFLALLAIIQGEWRLAMGWIALTIIIDGVDGALARRFRVKDVLPSFDGALLDNMVDYFTYTIVPAVFLYQSALLPRNWDILGITVMVLASSYQFAQADAKDDDSYHSFKGFPSYWNVMAVYLLMFDWTPWVNLLLVLFFSLLVFVPIKYVYHSRTIQFRKLTLFLSIVWGLVVLILALLYPQHPIWLLYGSLFYAFYYLAISLHLMKSS